MMMMVMMVSVMVMMMLLFAAAATRLRPGRNSDDSEDKNGSKSEIHLDLSATKCGAVVLLGRRKLYI